MPKDALPILSTLSIPLAAQGFATSRRPWRAGGAAPPRRLRRSARHALDNTALFEEAETQKTLLEHTFASTSDGSLLRDRNGQVAALNRRGELLVSDGILEIPDAQGRRPGLAGLAALLEKVQDRPPIELAETIVEDAVVRSGAVLRDDVTVVALRR